MRCEYADSPIGGCAGPVMFTMHDRRGCFDLCWAHVQWRMTTSVAPGHSSNCPKATSVNLNTQGTPIDLQCNGVLMHDQFTPCPVHDK